MAETTMDLTAPIPISTNAVLRRWRDDDASAVAAACNDVDIARWIPVPQPYTVDEARRYIELTRTWWTDGERFVLCIELDGVAVGSVSMRLEPTGAAIGYWLAPGARGRGLMTRAVDAMAAIATSDLGLREVWIYVQPANRASRAVAERAGFTEYGARSDFSDGKRRVVYRRTNPQHEHG